MSPYFLDEIIAYHFPDPRRYFWFDYRYRARIEKIESGERIHILYVDYGNVSRILLWCRIICGITLFVIFLNVLFCSCSSLSKNNNLFHRCIVAFTAQKMKFCIKDFFVFCVVITSWCTQNPSKYLRWKFF